tara:strand:- start:342 stop:536 length:195 start_codon:yes stop_codon:yes gene_type:complete
MSSTRSWREKRQILEGIGPIPFEIVLPPVAVWAGEFRSLFDKYNSKTRRNKRRTQKELHIHTSY